jgi:hypothetical protein
MDVYILENNNTLMAYGLIYSYMKYRISLLEIVSTLSEPLNEKFLSSLLNHVPSGNIILFSTTQEYLKDYFLFLGGKLYREHIIMKYINEKTVIKFERSSDIL